MRRNSPGAFGRLRPRRLVAALLALVIVTACGPGTPPTFVLSIRNSGDALVRLRVVVDPEDPPDETLVIPGHSTVLRTEPAEMHLGADGQRTPVTVEVYTELCALLTTVEVGEGHTRIDIGEGFSVTTAQPSGAPGSSSVTPGIEDGC